MNGSSRRDRILAFVLVAFVGAMVGASYAAVPLYRMFCQVTGFGGTTQVSKAAPAEIPVEAKDRLVTVRFDGNVNSQLPWSFEPAQREVTVKVGEQTLAFYRAKNLSDKPVTGTASFNVSPHIAGAYFDKIACFCFTEQTLQPGETVDMPVSFFIDPDVVKDREMDGVTITLSYTFFRASDGAGAKQVRTAPAAAAN
ncbi:MAG: cytochrome c oxidase assembly protein [Alphaproteobacteria bacterium]